jgi:small conductance mechanosensitive channel
MFQRFGTRRRVGLWFCIGAIGLASLAGASAARAAPETPAPSASEPAAQATSLAMSQAGSAPASAPRAAPSAARQLLDSLGSAKTEVTEMRRVALPLGEEGHETGFGAVIEAGSRYRRTLADAALTAARSPAPAGTVEELRELRSMLMSELEAEASRLAEEAAKTLALIVRLAGEADSAAPDARVDVERRKNRAIGWYTLLFGSFHDNLAARTRLGLDVSLDRAKFVTLLQEASKLTSSALRNAESAAVALEPKPGATLEPEAQARLAASQEFRKLLADAQRKYIDYMDEYGLNTVQLRQDLISTTGDVSHDILDPRVLGGLFGEWKGKTLRWLSERAPVVAFSLLSFAVIIAMFGILARVGRGLVRRAFSRSKGTVSGLAGDFVVTSTGRLIWLLGLVIAAAQLGIEVAPLIAGLGIAGFVAGFALQDTLSNFAAGLMILIYRPFDVGDFIQASGVEGNVRAMTLVYTSVLTPDNQMLIVPNSKVWGGVIRNVTHQAKRRVDLQFSVSYRDDLARAEALLVATLRENPRVLKDPAPDVQLHELGDSSAKFVVRPWVNTQDYWPAYWEVTREVKRRFDQEGFAPPFPQQELHIHDERRFDRAARDSEVVVATR